MSIPKGCSTLCRRRAADRELTDCHQGEWCTNHSLQYAFSGEAKHLMRFKVSVATIVLTLATAAGTSLAQASNVDTDLPDYQKAAGVSGNLSSAGSDTLANLMTLWAEAFKRNYPNVNVQIQAAGSSTAPPALTEGTANVGPMSRTMKDNEIEAFESKYGYKPTAVPVAIDALAVFVQKDNPVENLTLQQLDGIFSSTRKCGGDDISRWSQVGVSGSLAEQSIQLYGRNSVSGTYGYFKEHALCKGDYKSNVNEQPGSASVVQSVSTSLNAIGYSGIGYKTASVKTVNLAKKEGGPYVAATADNAINGSYPLARFLYIYVNKAPNQPLPPLERELIRLIMSRQGQEVVVRDGYVPLPRQVVEKALGSVGLQ